MSKKNHKDPLSVPFHQELIDQENFLIVQLMRIVSRQLKTDPDTKIFGDGSLPVEVDLSEIHKPFQSTQAIDAAFQRLVVRGIVVFFDDSFSGPVGGRIIEIYKEKLEKAFQELADPAAERFLGEPISEQIQPIFSKENVVEKFDKPKRRSGALRIVGEDLLDEDRRLIKTVSFRNGIIIYETIDGSTGKIPFVSNGIKPRLTKQGKIMNLFWEKGKRCYRGKLEDQHELEERGEIISLSNFRTISESKDDITTMKMIQDIAGKFKDEHLKMGPKRIGGGYIFCIYKK